MKKRVLFVLLIMVGIIGILFSQTYAYEKKVTLASLDWEPYIGSKLNKGGYVAEIARQAFIAAGYKSEDIEIKYLPWSRAVKISENGQTDGLFPEYYVPEREELFVYSDPFPGGPVGFYQRKNMEINYKDFDDLAAQCIEKNWKIGVVRGYVNTEEFDANTNIAKVKDEANSDKLNILKLAGDRVELIFIDKFVASYIIDGLDNADELKDKLMFKEPPLEEKDLFICFPKKRENYKEKLADFNKGLKILKDQGKIDAILKEYGFGN